MSKTTTVTAESVKSYRFTLTGITPCLFHSDDVEAGDDLKEWRRSPDNKDSSVPGDDRSPAWTWQTYLYHDGTHVAVPATNLMKSLCYAGSQMTLKGKTTFKKLSQSGLLIPSEYLDFRYGPDLDRKLPIADVLAVRESPFKEQSNWARDRGFRLFVKRAPVGVGGGKHVRVRARFDSWRITGVVQPTAPELTPDIVAKMFEVAGKQAGLLDWRPASPKSPGAFGMYMAKLEPV